MRLDAESVGLESDAAAALCPVYKVSVHSPALASALNLPTAVESDWNIAGYCRLVKKTFFSRTGFFKSGTKTTLPLLVELCLLTLGALFARG